MTSICNEKELTDEQKYKQLKEFINKNKDKEGYLIQVLHEAQSIFGYLPAEVQKFIAKEMNLSVSRITGVVTFYSYFKTNPTGRHTIAICLGTACYVRGAKKVLEGLEEKLRIGIGQTTKDGRFSINDQRCLGACGLAPVIMIDGDVYGRMTAEKLNKILEQYK